MCGSSAPAPAAPPPPPPAPPPVLEQSAPQTSAPKQSDTLATQAAGTKKYRSGVPGISQGDAGATATGLAIPTT